MQRCPFLSLLLSFHWLLWRHYQRTVVSPKRSSDHSERVLRRVWGYSLISAAFLWAVIVWTFYDIEVHSGVKALIYTSINRWVRGSWMSSRLLHLPQWPVAPKVHLLMLFTHGCECSTARRGAADVMTYRARQPFSTHWQSRAVVSYLTVNARGGSPWTGELCSSAAEPHTDETASDCVLGEIDRCIPRRRCDVSCRAVDLW